MQWKIFLIFLPTVLQVALPMVKDCSEGHWCVRAVSGNRDQPFTLNLNAATANITGGSSAAAPAINSEVGRIVNPGVTYNAGGRRL